MFINIRTGEKTIFVENSLEFKAIWDPIIGEPTYLMFKKWSNKIGDRLRIIHIDKVNPETEAEKKLLSMLKEECQDRIGVLSGIVKKLIAEKTDRIPLETLYEETGVCEKTIVYLLELQAGKPVEELLEVDEEGIFVNLRLFQ